MRLQVPIGGVQSLPDPIEVRMPGDLCRTIQLLGLRAADGDPERGSRHAGANESLMQCTIPLLEMNLPSAASPHTRRSKTHRSLAVAESSRCRKFARPVLSRVLDKTHGLRL